MANLDSDSFTAAVTVLGAGGVAAWIRERRKGKKDAYNFALELIEKQHTEIAELREEMWKLQGKLDLLMAENNRLMGLRK